MRFFQTVAGALLFGAMSGLAYAQPVASPTTPDTTTSVPSGTLKTPPVSGPSSDSPTAQRPGPSTGTGEGTAGTATGGPVGGNPSKN